jgi:DNA-binding NarL/FixJ family response regulator
MLASSQQETPFGMLIVSHVRFLRESLGEIFGHDTRCTVVGLCADLPTTLATCATLRPEVVLLDAAFPDALSAVGRIRGATPRSQVVALAVTETEQTVIAWAEAGIAGYVPSTAALGDLSAMLTAIVNGAQSCSDRVAAGLLRRIAEGTRRAVPLEESWPLSPLTRRERQIIDMIDAGLSNKDIARRLNIGLATTKTHVHNLLGKLNMQRRGQAAVWLREHRSHHGVV